MDKILSVHRFYFVYSIYYQTQKIPAFFYVIFFVSTQIMPCPLIRHPHQISLCPSERGMQANTKEAFSQNSL